MKIYDPHAQSPATPTTRFPLWHRLSLTALAIYWGLLLLGTHVPQLPRVDMLSSGMDKVCHFVAYAGLAFLLAMVWSLRRSSRSPLPLAHLATIVVLLATYGVLDEVTQPWVGRSCELGDWIADLCGAVMGVVGFGSAWSISRWLAATPSRHTDRVVM